MAIQFVGKNIHDFCSPYFTSATYRLAYEKCINPIPVIDQVGVCPNTVVIKPWITKRRSGRPKKKRMPSRVRETAPIKCGRCHRLGHHNRKTCNAPIKE